jgi:hypothetical protein
MAEAIKRSDHGRLIVTSTICVEDDRLEREVLSAKSDWIQLIGKKYSADLLLG